MQTGKLDQRVTIQQKTEVNDGGQIVISYQDVATVWAHVVSQKGSEAFEAARVNATETIRMRIRYRDDVDITMRCVWLGQNYNIQYIDRAERRDGALWLTCEVVGAE